MTENIPTPPPITTMTEDEFDAAYTSVQGPDGSNWIDTSEWDWITQFPENQRWTVVDTDDGQCIIPGIHYVNRVAYVVTKEAWPDENIEVEVDWPSDDEEESFDDYGAPPLVYWQPGDEALDDRGV